MHETHASNKISVKLCIFGVLAVVIRFLNIHATDFLRYFSGAGGHDDRDHKLMNR